MFLENVIEFSCRVGQGDAMCREVN